MYTSWKDSKKELSEAVAKSLSYAGTCRELGLSPKGGNIKTIRKWIEYHNIDKSHFTGQGWTKGRTFPPRRPIEDYLTGKQRIQSLALKKRLIKEGLLEHKCSICGVEEWMGKKAPIQLDHIDGNRGNNSLKNLRILCPNCHAQTDTYCGRNVKGKKKPYKVRQLGRSKALGKIANCPACNSEMPEQNKFCSQKCSHKAQQKIDWDRLSLDDLLKENKNNVCAVARILGVSDNAVRKHMK